MSLPAKYETVTADDPLRVLDGGPENGSFDLLLLDGSLADPTTIPAQLPEAAAIVDPKRPDCDYPFEGLAAVGLVFKLVQALTGGRMPTAERRRYLNDLLEWYDEFNDVRTQFFTERGTFDKMVPASTGIGAGSAAGEAMVSALLAAPNPRSATLMTR